MSNTTRPTRYPALGYRMDIPRHWRIVDISTDASIGHSYPTKAELLADLDRFAELFGVSDS